MCIQLPTIAQTRFQKTTGTSGGERNYHIATTKGGGIIATGYTDAVSSNKDDAILVKYNQFGKVLWANTYGDAGDDYSWDVIVTSSNDIVGCGYSSSFGTGHNVATMTKTDSTGKVVWLAGALNLSFGVEFYRVIETSNGDFLAAGLSGSSSNNDEMVVCKFTSSGRLIWSKNIGTSGSDEIMGITETAQGHYLFAGLANDPNGYGSSDMAAVKLDTSGRLIWKKIYGGSAGERFNSVIEIDNSYYFCGWTTSFGSGENDMLVMNTDSAGKVNWVKAYGSSRNDLAFNLIADLKDSSIVVAGYTEAFSSTGQSDNRNTCMMKIDFKGNLTWANSFGGNKRDGHWPTGLAANYDDGYYAMGSTNTFGAGDYDLFLVKTNAGGNSACNQRDPGFFLKNGSWKGKTFGSISNVSLTSATGSVSGSTWKVTEKNLCCKLLTTADSDTLLCISDTAKLGTAGFRGYSYKWLYNNKTVGQKSELTVPFGNGGFYDLEISAKGGGCATVLHSVEVENSVKPTTGVNTSYEFCDGDSVKLSLSSSLINPLWTALSTGDTTSKTDLVFKTTEKYLLSYKNNDGCAFNDTIVSTNNHKPNFKLHSSDSSKTCDSFLVQLPNRYSYFWSHDGGLTDSFAYLDSQGNYTVTAILGNCFHSENLYLEKPDAYVFSIGADRIICPESETTFYITADSLNITWSDGSSADSFTVDSTGTYWVEASKQGLCPSTDSFKVIETDIPNGLFQKDTVSFVTSTQLKPSKKWDTYSWDSGDTTDTLTIMVEGWYSLTVTDSNGCVFTDSIFADRIVGLEKPKLLLAVYPNPAKTKIYWSAAELGNTKNSNLILSDLSGRVVLQWDAPLNQLDISSVKAGLYVLQLNGDDLTLTTRIVIE